MSMKFIRGLTYPNANSNGKGAQWRQKWIYEFWGFCINGTSSTTVPGGFATNGVSMPTNFTDGTCLLASGTDGVTDATPGDLFSGDCVFTSASATFTTSMIGKALVIWKAGSNSSEDSIYVITNVINSNQITININTGGTPHATTKHPSMTSRTGINYRLVDMEVGANAIFVASTAASLGHFLVLNLDASSINPGQGNGSGYSQLQITSGHSTGTGASSFGLPYRGITCIGLSGSGSWNGNTLTVTGASNATPIQITTSASHGLVTGQTVSIIGVNGNYSANGAWFISVTGANTFTLTGSVGIGAWTSGGTVYNGFQNDGYAGLSTINAGGDGGTSGQTNITMIGDKTSLIAHLKGGPVAGNVPELYLHFEIPTRLYSENSDLHPIAFLAETNNALITASSTLSYGGGFQMKTHSSDSSSIRSYRTLVKAMRGDGTPDVFGQNLTNYLIGYNTITGTVPSSDGVLCLPGVTNQYCLARVRLRTVKFTGTHIPKHHRIGLNGEFIQIQNGIAWPWDNTIQPQQLLLFGSG